MAKKVKKWEPVAQGLTCWNCANWPQHVYPHDPDSGRHLIRSRQDALLKAGALVREGRELVVIGHHYIAWLQSLSKGVREIDMPCNAPALIAKRKSQGK
jgi:hypothetical protein